MESKFDRAKLASWRVRERIKEYLGTSPVPRSWGGNLVGNFSQGMESKFDRAKLASWRVRERIKEYLGSSPAYSWGRNLVENFAQGMESKRSRVINAALGLANKIKNLLGFHSPTKEGPGREADKWAPNFVKMFAEGLKDNVDLIKRAMTPITDELTNIAPTTDAISARSNVTGAIYTTVYNAVANALSEAIVQIKSEDAEKTIVLEIDGREFARATIQDFAIMAKRQGVKFS